LPLVAFAKSSSTGCSIVKGRAYQCLPLRRRSRRRVVRQHHALPAQDRLSDAERGLELYPHPHAAGVHCAPRFRAEPWIKLHEGRHDSLWLPRRSPTARSRTGPTSMIVQGGVGPSFFGREACLRRAPPIRRGSAHEPSPPGPLRRLGDFLVRRRWDRHHRLVYHGVSRLHPCGNLFA
jgi:hypothetical protein